MKKTKIMTGIIGIGAFSTLLTGCGSVKGSAAQASTSGAAKQLPTGQTLTVWSWKNGPFGDTAKKIAETWAKQHGDTVKWVDQTGNPQGFAMYEQAARSNKGPDIAFGIPVDIGSLHNEGLIAEVPHGLINPSDYSQGVVDSSTYQGKTWYALPDTVETTVLFYNKDKVKTPPKSWTSFVTDANQHGFMFDQANFYFNYALIGGFGGYVFKNKNGTLDPTDIGLANAGAIQAFQLLRNMDVKYHWMTPSTTGGIATSKFSSEKIGLYISGPWDIPNMKKAKVNFGVAPWPTLPNGHSATPFLGVQTTIVNARSKTLDADWSLASALSNQAAQTQYFKIAGQVPASLSLENSKLVQGNSDFAAFATEVKTAVPVPNIPQMNSVWGSMGVIQNIIKGSVTPKQGAEDFVRNIKTGISISG